MMFYKIIKNRTKESDFRNFENDFVSYKFFPKWWHAFYLFYGNLLWYLQEITFLALSFKMTNIMKHNRTWLIWNNHHFIISISNESVIFIHLTNINFSSTVGETVQRIYLKLCILKQTYLIQFFLIEKNKTTKTGTPCWACPRYNKTRLSKAIILYFIFSIRQKNLGWNCEMIGICCIYVSWPQTFNLTQ